MVKEYLMRFGSVCGFALAAILGVCAANYIDGYVASSPWMELGAGVVVTAVPAFLVHESGGAVGMLRILMGVAGVTLILRAICSAGMLNLQASLPAQVAGVF